MNRHPARNRSRSSDAEFAPGSIRVLLLAGAVAACAPSALSGQPASAVSGEDVLVSQGEVFPHVEPHLAVDPSDPSRLVVAAMTLPKEGEGFRVRVYRSGDGGRSWTGAPLKGAGASPSARDGSQDDPWLAFGDDGSLYLVHLPGVVWRSEDNGESWQTRTALPRGGAGHFDRTILAVDRSGGDTGGRVYVGVTQSLQREDEGSLRALAVLRSEDRGETFEGPTHVLPNDFKNKNGDLVVLPDGTLVATFHELFHEGAAVESPRLWSVRSTDGGRSFSTPSFIASKYLSLSPMLAVDRSEGSHGGRVYAAWLGLGGDRDHYLAHSDDAGATWSDPVPFASRQDSTVHPTSAAVAVGPDGTVGLFWPEPLPEMGDDCFELRFSATTDGAAPFTEPVAVSDEPYCSDTPGNRIVMHEGGPRGATLADRFQAGGDYYGLVGLPDGSFQAVWADARTGVFQLWTDRVRLREGE